MLKNMKKVYANTISRIKIAFVHMKIRTKFLLVFFIIMLASVSLIIFVVTKLSEKVFTDYSVDLTSELANQIILNVDNRVNEIEELAYTITQSSGIKEILYESLNGIELYEKKLVEQKVNAILNGYMMDTKYVDSIMIVSMDDDYYWWHDDSTYGSEYEEDVQLHYELFIKDKIPKDNSSSWNESPLYGDEIYLARTIIDEENINMKLGNILITFSNAALTEVATNKDLLVNTDNIAIIGKDDFLFFGTELISRRLYYKLVDSGDYLPKAVNQLFIKLNGIRYLIVENELQEKDWKVFIMIPQTGFDKGITFIQLVIYLLGIGAMVLTILIAIPISVSITKNIALLDSNMQRIEMGDFSVRIKPVSYDEIGKVSLRFNYMAGQIQNLVDQLYTTESEKRKIEQDILKAQINPHFLYNTLGSIKWMAESKGQEEISNLVTALIELLKVSIKQTGIYITLKKELDYIRNYMSIQLASLDGDILVKYMIEPDIEDVYVLNFMLQPIIENAIFHGLELRKGGNEITIKAYKEDRNLIIKVNDNGKGMTENKMKEILSSDITQRYSGLNSIGVKNVNERLKFYFGETYGLYYESEIGVGTTATFILPLKRSLEEGHND
ncbi:histidine kinase [Vallitalea pronyensis]|uniref:Histidine kinase n=1 Tax=Vallitalea pronyensis TaxID=1348613 RepID=A0A8J8SFH7_9FIRM|nr:histidine kinase [Vallitalea pronyensis]QUI21596.1 histidine kinase [Vallitalea pronyensis]